MTQNRKKNVKDMNDLNAFWQIIIRIQTCNSLNEIIPFKARTG